MKEGENYPHIVFDIPSKLLIFFYKILEFSKPVIYSTVETKQKNKDNEDDLEAPVITSDAVVKAEPTKGFYKSAIMKNPINLKFDDDDLKEQLILSKGSKLMKEKYKRVMELNAEEIMKQKDALMEKSEGLLYYLTAKDLSKKYHVFKKLKLFFRFQKSLKT